MSHIEHAITDMDFLSALTSIWRTAMRRLGSLLKIATSATLVIICSPGLASAEQKEVIAYESLQKGRPVRVTAEIYWPDKPEPVPAMVIHHGSSGVGQREKSLARELAAMGVAGVVIDSFGPRGVSSTTRDQNAVNAADFNQDAIRVLSVLGQDRRIDRSKIGIMGFSKGGTSTIITSHERFMSASGVAPDLRYALHVAFYPACTVQYWKPQTTGAPIYMLLGGADTYVGVAPCQTYAERLRATGAQVEVKIYLNAAHGFDGTGAPWFDTQGENYSQCVFEQQADGSWLERKSGIRISSAEAQYSPGMATSAKAAFDGCRTLGISGGPNEAARVQSLADLKLYVRQHLLGL